MSHNLCILSFALAIAVASNGRSAAQPPVRPGIEVLLADSLPLVRGKRIGILTNQTGVNRSGKSDVDLLHAAGLRLMAIFSPEHGFRGVVDRDNIADEIDATTGVPIHSLYGAVRAPTRDMLNGLDVLIVDLQDIGGRPYTYISTTLLTLQAAAAAGRRVIILDRPNPIGGELAQGPVLDLALSSFVGMLPVPLRHGLTLGELATLGNDVLGIHADLTVVRAEGWQRRQWFDDTGLPWIRPSPNMPDLESATHYPGLVILEATNLSVGRGTPAAFQVVGAPWLDAKRLIDRLTAVPNVEITQTVIEPKSPTDGKYDGQRIPAVRLRVTERAAYDPTHVAIALLSAVMSLHGADLKIDALAFNQRAGTDRVRKSLERGDSANRIREDWRADSDRFAASRKPYLLYR